MRNGFNRRVLGGVAVAAAMVIAVPLALGGSAIARSGYNTVPVRLAGPSHAFTVDAPGSLVGKNVDVTRRTGAQSETAIAVDPTDPSHVLAFQNDLTDTARLYESLDAGRTW